MNTKLVRFEEGDTIFKKGDTSREMYIIRSGKVRIMILKNEKLIPLTELHRGHYIGEMSFLTGIPRSATVIAATPVMANMITHDILSDENLGLSNWAVSIAKVLVGRIKKTTEILGSYIIRGKEENISAGGFNSIEEDFNVDYDSSKNPGRLYLKGILSGKAVDKIKLKIRELKLKQIKPVILDFSDVIDIDQGGIDFILNLTGTADMADENIKIENIQLIRDKVLSIKGIQDILTTTVIPVRRVENNEIIIRQGELDNKMYVVKSGAFSIYRETSKEKIKLAEAKAGDVIGEMSLIKQGTRSATVKAEKAGVVYVIDIREFYNNIYNIPGWFLELIQGLVERLRDTNEMLENLVNSRKEKTKRKKWNNPFCIVMDSSNPGEFLIKGNLTINNMQYVKQILKLEMKKGTEKIAINLSQVKEIDRESIISFMNIYTHMKTKNIILELKGPQKSILDLFRQYNIEEH